MGVNAGRRSGDGHSYGGPFPPRQPLFGIFSDACLSKTRRSRFTEESDSDDKFFRRLSVNLSDRRNTARLSQSLFVLPG